VPGYVKTPEECDRIEKMLTEMCFTCDELGINFETTWEFARWVMPPCIEPVGDESNNTAKAVVTITNYESAHCGTFDAAIVTLMAKYKDIDDGYWMLTEIVSPELPVVIGREMWGEVKKNGNGRFFRDGTHYYGYGERMGIKFAEIEAEITGADQGPSHVEAHGFDVKWFPHSSAIGLQYPPLLNIWDTVVNYTSYREGTGTLKWGHSKWDPTDTIPIVSVGTAYQAQYEGLWPLGQQIELEDPDNVYRRYMWGQHYDDPTFYVVGKRYQGRFELNPDPDAEAVGA
jgi:acetoacetate decarboxylase